MMRTNISIIVLLSLFLCYSLAYCIDLTSESSETDSILSAGLYTLRKTPEPEFYVTGVDIDTLVGRYLSKFEKIRDEHMWKWGRKCRLLNRVDSQLIEITIAVYSSIQHAEENILDYLNSISGVPKYGSASEVNIGDNSWFLNYEGARHGSVTFIRKNVFVNIFSSDYNLAEDIAIKVDRDLLAGAPGINVAPIVKPPKIDEIIIVSQIIKKGEEIPITIHATDPEDHKLKYFFNISYGGHFRNTAIPEKKIYFSNELGKHEISVCVINENNVVSEVKTIEIEVE